MLKSRPLVTGIITICIALVSFIHSYRTWTERTVATEIGGKALGTIVHNLRWAVADGTGTALNDIRVQKLIITEYLRLHSVYDVSVTVVPGPALGPHTVTALLSLGNVSYDRCMTWGISIRAAIHNAEVGIVRINGGDVSSPVLIPQLCSRGDQNRIDVLGSPS